MASEIKDLEIKQDDYKARMMACGERHTLALAIESSRNVILAWGSNSQGQMGVGRMPQSARPIPVPLPAPASTIITTIVCGSNFSMCLSDQGTIFSWGGNERGQLGLGDTQSRFKPEVVKALQGTFITSLTAGWSHVAAVATTELQGGLGRDDVYVWGDHQYGQLGVGSEDEAGTFPCYPSFFAFPKPLRLPSDIPKSRAGLQRERVSLALGTTHSAILVERFEVRGKKVIETKVYTCGMGKDGQLGRYANAQLTYARPVLVEDWDLHMDDVKFNRENKERVTSKMLPKIHLIAASDKATIAVSNPSDIEIVYTWGVLPGLNKDPNPLPTYIERLNNGEDLRRELASDLPINDFKVLKVITARSHHFLLCRYNEKANHGRAPVLFGWGETQYGKLGVGNVAKHMAEKALEQHQKASHAEQDGLEEQEQELLTVVQPELLKSFRTLRVRQVAAMADHNALCTDEGEAYVWGYGDSGRLGLGTGDGRNGASKSEAEPKVIPIFHKAERQMARVLRRRVKQQQEEKQQQTDVEGTEAADLARKSALLRAQFTRNFKVHKHENLKAALEQIELIHTAIVRRVDQSQHAVDSITSQQRIRETNEERRQLKMRDGAARKAAADKSTAAAQAAVVHHADGRKLNVPMDRPDTGALVCCCWPGADDWELDVDVESRGEADDDMEGFLEEKLLNKKVSFERDLLNSAELLVTRLYMQPCLMFRAYQLYASTVQSIFFGQDAAPRQRRRKGKDGKDKDAGATEATKAEEAEDTDKTKSIKTVEKANCMRNRFSNLVFSVYDLHRDEDVRVFHVFLRLVLEYTTRGKTKQSILTEDSIEWTLFRDIFMHGRIRRQLSDLLAKALSELAPFAPSNDRTVTCVTPVDWLDKYLQDKTPESVVTAFRLVRHKADQLLTIIDSEQFFSQMMSIIQWPLVVLCSALRRNKIDPTEVVGRVTMRILAEVMLADQTYQFEVKRRQLQRRGFGLQENNDAAEADINPEEDPNHLKLRGGKGWNAASAMDAVVCSGASQIGPSETLVLLQLRDVGAELTHDDVTDLMLYVTGRYKIPDYVMKQTDSGGGLRAAEAGGAGSSSAAGVIQSMSHAVLDHVSEHVREMEMHESKGESSTYKQMQLDLLTHFLKMPFFFQRRISQVSRSSLPLLCRSRDFCSSQDMKKVMKDLGYRSRLEEQNWHDWQRVNLRIDPTRCDFDLRRKSNEDPCEVCRCMHPRTAAVSGMGFLVGSGAGAGGLGGASDGQRKDSTLTFNKLECDLMFDILVEPNFNIILEELNGESAWHAIMSELKAWRERRIDEYSEQEGGHDYEIAAYAFKRLIRVIKGTKIELGERHDLVSFVADSSSVEPLLLKEKLTERDHKKRHYMDEEQRKVAALDTLKRIVDHELKSRPAATQAMSRNFEGITSSTAVDSKFVEVHFGLTIKNTDQRTLKKFSDRMHRWDKVHVVRERGKVVRFSYQELTGKGILYRVKPLRKYLPCVNFCCLSTMACMHCVDEDEGRLIKFLGNVHFVMLTTADPDLVHLKLSYQTEVGTAHLVILRSMLVSLKALASDDCHCHKISYDPLGDDVPVRRPVVFQFSKAKLKRLLQKFPRNMKDDGIQEKDDDIDII